MICRYYPDSAFPKWEFLPNPERSGRLHGGELQVAAQANVRIDAEIGQKDHFWMETVMKRALVK